MKHAPYVRGRTAVALVLGAVAFLLSALPLYPLTGYVEGLCIDLLNPDLGIPATLIMVVDELAHVVLWLPPMAVGICMFLWSSREHGLDDHTRCGRCGYILDGLGQAQCPGCRRSI
jgi:hypothetical protein